MKETLQGQEHSLSEIIEAHIINFLYDASNPIGAQSLLDFLSKELKVDIDYVAASASELIEDGYVYYSDKGEYSLTPQTKNLLQP